MLEENATPPPPNGEDVLLFFILKVLIPSIHVQQRTTICNSSSRDIRCLWSPWATIFTCVYTHTHFKFFKKTFTFLRLCVCSWVYVGLVEAGKDFPAPHSWETSSGLLQEQQTLLTTQRLCSLPSLQASSYLPGCGGLQARASRTVNSLSP